MQGRHLIIWSDNGGITISEPVVIEKVNELPIFIGEHGYCTFYTPVDAILNGAKAYGGTLKSSGLQLNELSNNLPAKTAFIVSGQPNSWVTLSLQSKQTFPAIPTEKNVLFGYDIPRPIPIEETFAFSRSTGRFLPLKIWRRPFRAYLSDHEHVISASPDGLKIGLITSTLRTKYSDEEGLLFNLNGLRVEKPIPGTIYIRNGKKFIAR